MNKLPYEIQNIILNYYWEYKYDKVIDELKSCYNLEMKIKKFLKHYCYRESFFDEKYLFYLISFNNDIKNMIKNQKLKLLCDISNLTLYYCFDINYKNKICDKIHENLKYISIFCISSSGQMRYIILHKFQKLSQSKMIYNF